MTPQELLAEQIADAKIKLHRLLTGKLSVEVHADGYITKFNHTNISELRAYIRELEMLLSETGRPVGGAVIPIWSR